MSRGASRLAALVLALAAGVAQAGVGLLEMPARGETGPAFAMPVAALARPGTASAEDRRGRVYLRFTVADRPGVLAEITAAMRDAGVSIESLIQRGVASDGNVLIAIVTHVGPERAVHAALDRLEGSQSLTGKPMLMHILDE